MRKMFIAIVPVISAILVVTSPPATAATSGAPSVAQSALNSRSLNSIEAYAKSLEAFKKRNPKRARIFGNLISLNQETYPIPHDAPRFWEEFPTRKARESAALKRPDITAYDGAEVWRRNGKVVLVQVEPGRYFHGGARIVTYYFRDDGSLAKIRFEFGIDGIDGEVVKETFYDAKGSVLQTRMQCMITERGRRRIVNCSRMLSQSVDDAPPVYRRVEELPFINLLKDNS